MTKGELVERLKDTPDDVEVWIEPCTPGCLGEAPIESIWIEEIDGRRIVQLSRAKA